VSLSESGKLFQVAAQTNKRPPYRLSTETDARPADHHGRRRCWRPGTTAKAEWTLKNY